MVIHINVSKICLKSYEALHTNAAMLALDRILTITDHNRLECTWTTYRELWCPHKTINWTMLSTKTTKRGRRHGRRHNVKFKVFGVFFNSRWIDLKLCVRGGWWDNNYFHYRFLFAGSSAQVLLFRLSYYLPQWHRWGGTDRHATHMDTCLRTQTNTKNTRSHVHARAWRLLFKPDNELNTHVWNCASVMSTT